MRRANGPSARRRQCSEHEEEDGAAEHGQDDGLGGQAAPGKDPEGHPHVPSMDEADQTGDDLVGLVQAEVVADQCLGDLVEDDDGRGDGHLGQAGDPGNRAWQAPIVAAGFAGGSG